MPVSDDMVSKRLRAVDQSQESIEIASMWIMHHKDSAHVIVNGWMNTFRLGQCSDSLSLSFSHRLRRNTVSDFPSLLFSERSAQDRALLRRERRVPESEEEIRLGIASERVRAAHHQRDRDLPVRRDGSRLSCIRVQGM